MISTNPNVNYIFPAVGIPVVISYQTWRKILFNYAQLLFPEFDSNGLLGALADAPEYLIIAAGPNPDPNAAPPTPFVPPPPPGAVPQAPNAQALYTNVSKLYRSYQIALANLKSFMLSSLDLSIHPSFADPTYGAINLSPARILARLDDLYLHMTPEDSQTMKRALAEPFVDGRDRTMTVFTQKHRELHVMFFNNGTVINDRDKYEFLRDAVAIVPFYATIIELFKHAVPTYKAQTFEALTDTLIAAESNRPMVDTTATHGYASRAMDTIKPSGAPVSRSSGTASPRLQEARVQYYCPKCLRWCNAEHPTCMSKFKKGDIIPKAPTVK
jgi:hypothetical protein